MNWLKLTNPGTCGLRLFRRPQSVDDLTQPADFAVVNNC
jgi:hypothetical protein